MEQYVTPSEGNWRYFCQLHLPSLEASVQTLLFSSNILHKSRAPAISICILFK